MRLRCDACMYFLGNPGGAPTAIETSPLPFWITMFLPIRTLMVLTFIARISLSTPTPLTLPINSSLLVRPSIICASGPERLSLEALRECKSAIAFLPRYSTEIRPFGPNEPDYAYRTPIISDHATRCTARVEMRRGFSEDRSSWEEVRGAFWEMSGRCLDQLRTTGTALMGERYGLQLRLVYDFADDQAGLGIDGFGAGRRAGGVTLK